MPPFDRLMYMKANARVAGKRGKTFTFILVRRRKSKWKGGRIRHSFRFSNASKVALERNGKLFFCMEWAECLSICESCHARSLLRLASSTRDWSGVIVIGGDYEMFFFCGAFKTWLKKYLRGMLSKKSFVCINYFRPRSNNFRDSMPASFETAIKRSIPRGNHRKSWRDFHNVSLIK
jgi:hypothetical protein